jgi:hypothetical protein
VSSVGIPCDELNPKKMIYAGGGSSIGPRSEKVCPVLVIIIRCID